MQINTRKQNGKLSNASKVYTMLSQTKMQLWYPKKSQEEPSTNDMVAFHTKCKKGSDDGSEENQHARDTSPTNSNMSDGNEDVDVEFLSEDCSSRAASFEGSDCDEVEKGHRREEGVKVSDFVDLDYWRKETICCGTIFRGMYDEIILDPRFLKPCKDRLDQTRSQISSTDDDI